MSMDATEILHTAEICIGDRAASRDQPDGERSMARTVAAFNALTGHRLSERDGWLFGRTESCAGRDSGRAAQCRRLRGHVRLCGADWRMCGACRMSNRPSHITDEPRTLAEHAEILRPFNIWRRWDGDDEDSPQMQEPRLIDKAIDAAVECMTERAA